MLVRNPLWPKYLLHLKSSLQTMSVKIQLRPLLATGTPPAWQAVARAWMKANVMGASSLGEAFLRRQP